MFQYIAKSFLLSLLPVTSVPNKGRSLSNLSHQKSCLTCQNKQETLSSAQIVHRLLILSRSSNLEDTGNKINYWLTSGCLDAQALRVSDRFFLLNVKLDQSIGKEKLEKERKKLLKCGVDFLQLIKFHLVLITTLRTSPPCGLCWLGPLHRSWTCSLWSRCFPLWQRIALWLWCHRSDSETPTKRLFGPRCRWRSSPCGPCHCLSANGANKSVQ